MIDGQLFHETFYTLGLIRGGQLVGDSGTITNLATKHILLIQLLQTIQHL